MFTTSYEFKGDVFSLSGSCQLDLISEVSTWDASNLSDASVPTLMRKRIRGTTVFEYLFYLLK